jgi:hypothetical protein
MGLILGVKDYCFEFLNNIEHKVNKVVIDLLVPVGQRIGEESSKVVV